MKSLLHFFSKLFNITHYEWPRVLFAFVLKVSVYVVYVTGSTLLTASFLEQYHIENLPLLYIFVSSATILGSFLFGFLLESVEKKKALIWISVLSIFVLVLTGIVLERSVSFFVLFILFLSVALSQLNILLSLFIEELFSPLESERTLPFVEAAEPVAGIIAGALLAFGANIFSIGEFFNFMMAVLVVLMFLISFSILLDKTPRLVSEEEGEEKTERIKKIVHGFRHIKGMKFLKSMALVVFLQFSLYTLVEFQYTSALDSSISHEVKDEGHGEHGAAEGHDKNSYSAKLAHGLGLFHIVFSGLFFVSQLLLSARINKRFGIIHTMTLHPVLMLAPGIGLLNFNLVNAVVAKASFEVLSGIHRTAYHASIYALKHSIRDYVKEFFEGVMKPLGMLFATSILVVLASFLHGEILYTVITGLIIGSLVLMTFVLVKMKDKYTQMSKKNLEIKGSILPRLEAIEVLTQKGHKNSEVILGKILNKKSELIEVKEKVLESLGELKNQNSIPDILDCLESENTQLQKAALKALLQYKNIGKNFFKQSFTKYRVINSLKEIFSSTKSKEVKSLVIQNFANLKDPEIVEFILEILDSGEDEIKANIIYIFKYFDDVNINYYIKKYLEGKHNPRVKASTIIALWQFVKLRLNLTIEISKMILSKEKEEKLSAIYILGEIKAEQEIPKLERFLEDEDKEIKREAAIALLKMNNISAVEHVLSFLLHEDEKIGKGTKNMLKNIPENIFNHIKNLLKHEVTNSIKKIIEENKTNILEKLSEEKLKKLMHFYSLIDEQKEVIRIRHLLESKKARKSIIDI